MSILGRLIDDYRETARPDALGLAGAELDGCARPERRRRDRGRVSGRVPAPPRRSPSRPIPRSPWPSCSCSASCPRTRRWRRSRELVDLRPLRRRAAAAARGRGPPSRRRLDERPAFPDDPRSLIDLLREPARRRPSSLAEQLRYIRDRPGASASAPLLGDLLDQLLVALDVLAEERHAAELAWLGSRRMAAPARPRSTRSPAMRSRPSGSALDTEWMPRLILRRQEHLRLARPALAATTGARSGPSTRSPTRSSTISPARDHRPVADRPVGAQPGLGPDQAAPRPARRRRLGLLARRLRHRRRPRRRRGPRRPARAGPAGTASAWPATWCPTTWASTRAG